MTYSSQNSGVERGAARVRHSRPTEGVPEFPCLRDVREVWFSDIFSLKNLTLPRKCDSCDGSHVDHVTGHMLVTWQVTWPGLAWHVYINFVSLLGFSYSCNRSHVGHVTGHVTWPIFISLAFSFGSSYSLFFPFFLFLTYSSSGMPAIASSHLSDFLGRNIWNHTSGTSLGRGNSSTPSIGRLCRTRAAPRSTPLIWLLWVT